MRYSLCRRADVHSHTERRLCAYAEDECRSRSVSRPGVGAFFLRRLTSRPLAPCTQVAGPAPRMLQAEIIVTGFSPVPGSHQRRRSPWGYRHRTGRSAMPVNIVSRVAARAVISAALAAGSLSLTATAAGACASSACGAGPLPVSAPRACTTPDCIKGVPPAAAVMECTDPKCISGTQPTAAPRPRGRPAGQTAINCPPPNPSVTTSVSDC